MKIVYKYGLCPPVEGRDAMVKVLEQGHALRQALFAVEVERRKAVRAAYHLDAECVALRSAAIEASKAARAALRAVRALRGATGFEREIVKREQEPAAKKRRRGALAEQKPAADLGKAVLLEALKQARDAEKAAIRAWKARMAAAAKSEPSASAIAAANDHAQRETKRVYGESPLRSGSKEVVLDACRAAFKVPLYEVHDGRPTSWPNDPEPRDFEGQGHVAVRFTSPCPGGVPLALFCERGFSGNTIARQARDPMQDKPSKADLRMLRLKVGKNTFIAWPMKMHRPIPSGARICSIHVVAEPRFSSVRYSAIFTIDVPLPAPSEATHDVGVVDVGWMREDAGAMHVASFGVPDEVVIKVDRLVLEGAVRRGERAVLWTKPVQDHPDHVEKEARTDVLASVEFARALRRVNKERFNEQLRSLVWWVKSIGEQAPAWLREAAETMPFWRNHGRLHALLEQWSRARFDADQQLVPPLSAWMDSGDVRLYGLPHDAYEAICTWAKKDLHIDHMASCVGSKAIRRRRWIYENFAARVARQCRVVVMSDQDFRVAAAKRKKNDDVKAEAMRHDRFIAAPGELRKTIVQAVVKAGGRVDLVQMAAADAPASATAEERCAAILRVWKDPARKDGIKSVFAEEKENAWDKRKRLKAEKLAREAAAREEPPKAAE